MGGSIIGGSTVVAIMEGVQHGHETRPRMHDPIVTIPLQVYRLIYRVNGEIWLGLERNVIGFVHAHVRKWYEYN